MSVNNHIFLRSTLSIPIMNFQLVPPANYKAYPGAEVKLARLQQLAQVPQILL